MKVLNSSEFKDYIQQADKPVLVDFFADWCGPCQMLVPILEQLSEDMQGKVEIVKVDIDESQDLAQEFGVTSIPTLIIYNSGEVVDRMTGFQSKDALAAKLSSL